MATNAKYNKPMVGIAVVAWNNESIISECLKSVKDQKYPNIKTVVLDNDSSDRTVELIEKEYPWVELIKSPINTGFSKGNNLIIKEFLKDKDIEYIVLLNSDATLDPKWINNLVDFARGTSNVAFLQGLTLDYYDHNIVDSTHIYVNKMGQGTQAGYRQSRKSIGSVPKKVFGVNAAACMVTVDFLRAQPFNYLFDEDFFMYLEDVDVAARSVVLGWDNYFNPNAVAYHMGSASSGKNPGFSVYMVNRNLLPMLIKNLPLGILIKLAPKMLRGDARELHNIYLGKNYKIMYKYITGRIRSMLEVPKYLKKRYKLSKTRKVTNEHLWELMDDGTLAH